MFLRRDKRQMPTPEEGAVRVARRVRLTYRPATRARRTRSSRRSPTAIEQAHLRHGLLLGRRAEVLADARRLHDRGRLRRRLTPNPTYEEVCAGRTGHTEVVLVVFDPEQVLATSEMLKVFWESHDPTQGMRQGNDVGTQYRSAIYTTPTTQRGGRRGVARHVPEGADGRRPRRITTEIVDAPGRSTTPRTTTSSTSPRTRTATAGSVAPGVTACAL